MWRPESPRRQACLHLHPPCSHMPPRPLPMSASPEPPGQEARGGPGPVATRSGKGGPPLAVCRSPSPASAFEAPPWSWPGVASNTQMCTHLPASPTQPLGLSSQCASVCACLSPEDRAGQTPRPSPGGSTGTCIPQEPLPVGSLYQLCRQLPLSPRRGAVTGPTVEKVGGKGFGPPGRLLDASCHLSASKVGHPGPTLPSARPHRSCVLPEPWALQPPGTAPGPA